MSLKQEVRFESQGAATKLERSRTGAARHVLFALFMVASAVVFWTPIRDMASLALRNDEYSHTIVMPLVSLTLIYLSRRKVFGRVHYSWGAGALFLLAGIAGNGFSIGYSARLAPDSDLFLRMLSLVAVWIGAFALCYGRGAFRAAAFPLLFLFLMVPIPGFLMQRPIVLVQHGSAEVASLLFAVAHVPVFRDGMRFSLPGLDMEVAIQCSGIHSTMALFIASLLVCYLWVNRGWKRLVLILSVLPIVCFTNGLRIFAISTLAVYVNPVFFEGNLHRRGGVLFFILALVLLAGIVKLLGKWGHNSAASAQRPVASAP